MTLAQHALASPDEIEDALRARKAVFRGLSPERSIFTSRIFSRAILYPCAHRLSATQFSALSAALRVAGESEYYMSYVPVVQTDDESFHQYWRLPRGDFSAYEVATRAPLEMALYSVKEEWGILTTDAEFAVVGGSESFIRALFTELPDDSATQARRFVEDWCENARLGSWRTDWVESMLPDIVGPEFARELLPDQGSN